MFRTVFLAFWILHIKFSASATPTNNAATQAEVSAAVAHPFLTGVKFIPFKTAHRENVPKREPTPSINTFSPQDQYSSLNNLQDQNPISRVHNSLPLNSLSTELLDKFSPLPKFELKKLPSAKRNNIPPVSNVKNAADSSDNSNSAILAAAVKLPPLNVDELTNTAADYATKFISAANIPPIPVDGLKNVDADGNDQFVSTALLPSASTDKLLNTQSGAQVPQPVDLPDPNNALPFPHFAFDPKIATSRKLIPPEPGSLSFEQPIPVQLSERITLPRQLPAAETLQAKNLPLLQSDLPADVKLVPIPTQKIPAAAAQLPTEILPPKEENLAEQVDTLSSRGYGILASQMVAVLNASTVKEDLPLIFQRLAGPQKAAHSPKKDVEVFAPLLPERPVQPPDQPPGIPASPPQFPFAPDGGAYPPDENPFVFNEYPAYPPFLPEEQPTEKPYVPRFPTLPPATRPTEEITRPTEDTTRATEETTPKLPKTTRTIPKITPWVPKITPGVPKNSPSPPKYTPPSQPNYTPDVGGHSWITRFYPGYPPTTKLPKGMPPPIWPMFTPRPTVPHQASNIADMVTPFMEKLISAASKAATSTTATPSVEILGEPSQVEPKYKLAVVSDYKNYDAKDGSFGFSIDLENGLAAKVRGYKKDGRHFIEGSYSLFANEGDPVNIKYIADNEEVKQIEQETTNIAPVPVSLDDSNATPTSET